MKKIFFVALTIAMGAVCAMADSVVTTKTYVDAKVVPQGSASGSIFTSSSPDDRVPSAKAVYTALDAIDGTAYTAGTGIGVANHVISNTGVTAVAASDSSTGTDGTISVTTNGTTAEVAVKGLAGAAYKSVTTDGTLADAAAASGEHSSDYASLPTAGAVKTYVDAHTGSNIISQTITDGVTGKAPSEDAVHDALAGKQDNLGGTVNNVSTAGKVVTATATAGTVDYTGIDTTVTNGSNNLVTSDAVYDAINTVQTAVTALQACTHTCVSSDPTNNPTRCDLITINCVDSGSGSGSNSGSEPSS